MTRLRHLLLTFPLLIIACSHSATVGDDVGPLTFLHLNDTYRIDAVEDGRRGGFARVTTLIRELEDAGRTVRLLHGGDFLYPSLESQLWDGEQMIEALDFMHALAPLVVVPGNHEFDRRTASALIDAVRQSDFAWVADNQRFATGAADVDRQLQQHFVAETGGYRVGIFGLTLHADDGGNERSYAPIDPDYVGAAERAITALERQNVDLILGLTHLHLADDRRVAALKAAHPRFLLIAGGHEHEPEFEPGDATHAVIVKGASNARTIWRIDVSGDPGDGAPQVTTKRITVDEGIEVDAAYRHIETRWRSRLLEKMPYLASKIGEAAVPLDGRETAVRNAESNWGDFIADRMRTAFGEPAADLAFLNAGTLRIDDIISDEITFEDVGRTFGFSSYLRRMEMTGSDFRALLETGYRGSGPSKGYFPQISGFRVCVDRRRPEGRRIVSLQREGDGGWKDIEPDALYSLVAPDFLYRGGDGYDFSQAQNVTPPGSELKYRVLDAIMGAQAAGTKIGAPIDLNAPRIVILDREHRRCFNQATVRLP